MNILLSPLGLGLLLALLLLAFWRGLPRSLRLLLGLAEVAMVLLCCPVGANVLVRLVEERVTAQCAMPAPPTIVLLSAGLQREPANAGDFVALEEINIDRILAAGLDDDGGGMLISSSRGIIFAGGGTHDAIRGAAAELHAGINAGRRVLVRTAAP